MQDIVTQAKALVEFQGRKWDSRLERILVFCFASPELFPGKNATPPLTDSYLQSYISRYYLERERPVVVTQMGTKPDPVINEVLQAFFGKSPSEFAAIEDAHRMSMAAENLVGGLLERYIATLLEQNGWVWCCGNTMKAIDFLKDDPAAPRLLQIKNRDNSENSSSSAIRSGTPIEKWFRIKSRTGQTCWEKLPDNQDGVLNEHGFYQFVGDLAAVGKVQIVAAPDGGPASE